MAELTNELKVVKDVIVNIRDPAMLLAAVQNVRKLLSTNLVRCSSIEAVIQQGLVPHLVKFLQDFDNDEIQSEAAWALANIAAGSKNQTKAVIDAGAVPRLMALLRFKVEKSVDRALFAFANIVGNGPKDRDIVLEYGIVDQIIVLLENGDLGIEENRSVARLILNVCRQMNPAPPVHEVKRLLPALLKLLQNDDAEILSLICCAY